MKNHKNRKKCDCDVRIKIKKPNLLHYWLHSVDITMWEQKKHPSILKYQSNIGSKPATGMQGLTITKNKHLTSLKAVKLGSGFIEPKENMTLFACKSDFMETVELCQQSIYIDVSQTEHIIMQMKTKVYMEEVNT